MRDQLAPGAVLGYCTNVHAGNTLDEIRSNLQTHACAVKAIVSPNAAFGIGLWLPAAAAREIITENQAPALRDWLSERGLFVFTINGFPYGDFHATVVKHAVYSPDWTDPRREEYTRDLIDILAVLLPDGIEGSISTVPIGWRNPAPDVGQAALRLVNVAEYLRKMESDRGVTIHLDLEPEPGCYLTRSADMVRLFEDHLLPVGVESTLRRHLRVCHDICHAAVMFEAQSDAIKTYLSAGIHIGKVQVSACPIARFDRKDPALIREALGSLVETRFLHQTVTRPVAAVETGELFFDDLPDALAKCSQDGEWRVHFHVPIFATSLGPLDTTSAEITDCLRAIPANAVSHFEIETYAWHVLPREHRGADLATDIAAEIRWLLQASATSRAS